MQKWNIKVFISLYWQEYCVRLVWADILEKPLANLSLNAGLALIHGLSEVLVVAPFFFSGYMFAPAQLNGGFIMSVVVLVGLGTVVHSFVDCNISVLLWKCVKSTVPGIKLIRG